MSQFKDIPGICAWCGSEDIDYEDINPAFDGDFIKFRLFCKKCGKKSTEIFHLEFHKTETHPDD